MYCESSRKKLQSNFNKSGWINTYFASAIAVLISVQHGFVGMTEVYMFLQCRGVIEETILNRIYRIIF